MGLFRWR